MRPRPRALAGLAVAAALLAACGSAAPGQVPTPTADLAAIPAAGTAAARLLDWPGFGLDPARSGASDLATGITSANVGHLHRMTVSLPGTVDSSPIYLHAVPVAGAARNVVIATTTYGRTVAVDADSGRILWVFTPGGYRRVAGTAQITTASPVADPGRQFLYAASPDGLIHKLAVADGREAPGWPVRVTLDATHEKLAASLNVDGPDVLAATGGYFGDAPPYQGHVVAIDRASGHVAAVFNTLCAGRRHLIQPSSCGSSDSAILSRAGVVVEPGGRRILISTGNGPWNGTSDFGDSVIELSFPALSLRQAYTPTDQARLNAGDTDLGSSGPAALGAGRAIVAGKDGILRLLSLARLDGHPPGSSRQRLGGELQRLATPGGGELFSAPAVWHHAGHTTVFIADGEGTAAYVLRRGRLARAWQNGAAGTSPVVAGGLLYVYDSSRGGIAVYEPASPRPIARLGGSSGHWNSPIVVDGHVVEPEGNANDHSLSGSLDIFSAR
jgi:outer membrane protein assembly factor BamB